MTNIPINLQLAKNPEKRVVRDKIVKSSVTPDTASDAKCPTSFTKRWYLVSNMKEIVCRFTGNPQSPVRKPQRLSVSYQLPLPAKRQVCEPERSDDSCFNLTSWGVRNALHSLVPISELTRHTDKSHPCFQEHYFRRAFIHSSVNTRTHTHVNSSSVSIRAIVLDISIPITHRSSCPIPG